MEISPLFIILAVVAVAVVASIVVSVVNRRRRVGALLSGQGVLAHWTYSPEEWRRCVERDFDWARHPELPAQIYVSDSAIYITNGKDKFYADLDSGGRLVTRAVVRGADPAVFKARVRWKHTEYTRTGKKVSYFNADYRFPIPRGREEEAARLADYFTAEADKKPDAIQAVMPEDAGLSILGKEPFDL